jgi:spermidine/putrescine transport system permease protein
VSDGNSGLGRPSARWRPSFLAIWTLGYFVWSLVPVALLVRISFSESFAVLEPRGFSLAWYQAALTDPDIRGAFVRSLGLAGPTALLATALGVGLGVGLRSWDSRWSVWLRPVVVAPIAVPQIVLAAGFFFAFQYPLGVIGFGRDAQLIGHTTIALPYVVLLVWARLLGVGGNPEEVAMDLGASPASAFLRVTLPLLLPAILSAMALSFVLSFDNLVVSQLLCIHDCTTVPMLLYGRGRAVVLSPAVVALGSMSLMATLIAMILFFLPWRLTRRWRATADHLPP